MAKSGSDAEEEFWARFDSALMRWATGLSGDTSLAGLISRRATEDNDEEISDRTISGWIDHRPRRLPRNIDQLMIVLRVLGADGDRRGWEHLLDRARIARKQRSRAGQTAALTTAESARQQADAAAALEPEHSRMESSSPPRELTSIAASDQSTFQDSEPAAIEDQPAEADEKTTPMHKRSGPRVSTWWAASAALLAAGTTSIVLTLSNDQSGGGAILPKATPAGVPCRRGDGPVGSTPASAAPAALEPPRPTAYAPRRAGRAELNVKQRRVVLTDDLSDGCATILTAKADGAEVGPWANTKGKTGRRRHGTTTSAKHINMPWLGTTGRFEFRVCLGEVIEGRITYQEADCGPMTTAELTRGRH